jgi:hypothetical protein
MASLRPVNRSAALVPIALVVALVSGCTGGSGEKPTVLPTVSTLPPPASPAPVPEPAKAKTPQGADAFVRFFFAQMNLAFASGEGGLIMAFSNEQCVACRGYEDAVATERQAGRHLLDDTFNVKEVAARPLEPLGTLVDVFGDLPARRQVDAAGRPVRTIVSGGAFHFQVGVKLTATGWVVSGIRTAPSS